jgi:glycosyltransferase involved in cell wall biosynthesis
MVLVQTVAPEYRQIPFKLLKDRCGGELQIFVGQSYFNENIQTGVSLDDTLVPLRNHFLFWRRLEWQSGVLRGALAAPSVILEFNPRIISNWVILLIRRLLKRRTALWGHSWSRRGDQYWTEHVRHAMRLLAYETVVYTDNQRNELAHRYPRLRVASAPNALYSSKDIAAAELARGDLDFIYVGRMDIDKRPALLLDAFREAVGRGLTANLVFVGEGSEMQYLKNQATSYNLSNRVTFTGTINDQNQLRYFYERAIASVSPGYVGLSLIQSLSFGVPMLIAADEAHSPEIAAAKDGENCIFFAEGNEYSLAEGLLGMEENKITWLRKRTGIAKECRDNYSAELMADSLAEVFTRLSGV